VPTHEERERFTREFAKLSPEMKRAFAEALAAFIADADSGRFRASLRVKRVRKAKGMWEMSFAGDGRATFERLPGKKRRGAMHIRWHRIGGHEILEDPRAR
jgi:hypothetical protein